jgi:hypothetical protein
MSDQSLDDKALRDRAQVGTFVLHLQAGTGESIVGSVGPAGGEAPVSFNGWVDFMAAITTLRAGIQVHGRADMWPCLRAGSDRCCRWG